ncbi:hypothetical protein [Halarcobacter anaerophilus]|uniref:hypothetical protein n=1 Tax=Halarcobacter anaerophilus TaxID=877500 RepID=UPI001D17C291|nr:hypothetical protein [Halarcobacter anaerophilus]
MVKIAIAGFGKIGQIRAKEIEKNLNATLIAIYDIKKPKSYLPKILYSVNHLMNYYHKRLMQYLFVLSIMF